MGSLYTYKKSKREVLIRKTRKDDHKKNPSPTYPFEHEFPL